MKFTSVVSLHTNPTTCGVAKFSAQLAERLGKEFVGFEQPHRWGVLPLFSIKLSEFDLHDYNRLVPRYMFDGAYGVYWHDAGDNMITSKAQHVFFADKSLGSPGLFCPSLIQPKKRTVK